MIPFSLNGISFGCLEHKEVSSSMRLLRSPKLRIHCWGGFGSQAFAWALAIDLRRKFPRRSIVIIQHQSGQTRRESEINFISDHFPVISVNDYSTEIRFENNKNVGHSTQISKLLIIVRKFVRFILTKTRFIEEANNDSQFSKVRFWILATRGHYSHRTITRETFLEMTCWSFGPFSSSDDETRIDSSLGIHWRLGDLMILEQKEPVRIERLMNLFSLIEFNYSKIERIEIASDSPSYSSIEFSKVMPRGNFVILEEDTIRVIKRFISSYVFIGTNSKISCWIAIARYYSQFEKISFLPTQVKQHIPLCAQLSSRIVFY